MRSPIILVIDDEPTTRRLVRSILEGATYEVVEASDGLEGLAIYDQFSPEIVLVDLIMDRMDGLETIRELRKRRSKAWIVVMSGGIGSGTLDILKMANALGADDTLDKPFRPDTLLAKVRQRTAA